MDGALTGDACCRREGRWHRIVSSLYRLRSKSFAFKNYLAVEHPLSKLVAVSGLKGSKIFNVLSELR